VLALKFIVQIKFTCIFRFTESLVNGNEIEDSQAFELIVEGDMEEVELDDECANKRIKLTENQINADFAGPVCSIGEPLVHS